MHQPSVRRWIVRAVVVAACVLVEAPAASAQQTLQSDWVRELLRMQTEGRLVKDWQSQIRRLERWILKGKLGPRASSSRPRS